MISTQVNPFIWDQVHIMSMSLSKNRLQSHVQPLWKKLGYLMKKKPKSNVICTLASHLSMNLPGVVLSINKYLKIPISTIAPKV